MEKKFNLSFVIYNDPNIRIDLLSGTLDYIDKFTTSYNDSKEVKENYKDEINKFMREHYVTNGSIVITYLDESGKTRRLRVLYKDEIDKLNYKKTLDLIKKMLNKRDDIKITLDIINRFTPYIFGSPYENNLKCNKIREIGINKERDSKINKLFVNQIIYNNLYNSLSNNFRVGYFKLRLIDSYMHKIGVDKSRINNLKIADTDKISDAKLNKENSNYKRVKSGEFYIEGDGQFNLFDEIETEKPKMRYKDYIVECSNRGN